MAEERGTLLAVWGPSGSPGTSTVAAGVAAVLASRNSVILVDCDATRGTVATALARSGTGVTLGGALLTLPPEGMPLPEGFLRQSSSGLRFLPGVVGPGAPSILRAERLGTLLERLQRESDVLVLDVGEELPRRAGSEIHIEVLTRADAILIVVADTPQGELDFQGEFPLLHETLTALERAPQLFVVVNHLESAHFAPWRRLLRDYHVPMTGHVPHDHLAALRAWERRQPLPVADPDGLAAKAIVALASDIGAALQLPGWA